MAEQGAVVAAGAVNAAGAARARGKEPCWGFWDGRRGNISLGKTGAAGEGGGDGLLGLTGGVRLGEHSGECLLLGARQCLPGSYNWGYPGAFSFIFLHSH